MTGDKWADKITRAHIYKPLMPRGAGEGISFSGDSFSKSGLKKCFHLGSLTHKISFLLT